MVTTQKPENHTQILREAATITKTNHQMPIKTSHQMMLEDSINAPNAQQIRDKVYRDSKKDQNSLKLNNITCQCAKMGKIMSGR